MLAIELDPRIADGVQGEMVSGQRLDGGELGDEFVQPRFEPQRRGAYAVAAVELQHIGYQALQALRVVVNDAGEARAVIVALFLLQELRGVADRGEGIADLVRDVGGEAPERSEL